MSSGYGGKQPSQTSYGYSGSNARPANSNTGMKIAAAAGAGLLVGGAGMYMYSRMNRNTCSGPSSYSGNCDGCYSQYSRNQCSNSYTSSLNRDDIMIDGFIPDDYKNTPPLMLRMSAISGLPAFGIPAVCPCGRSVGTYCGWNETKSVCVDNSQVTDKTDCDWQAPNTDLFVTLTEMFELEDDLHDDDPDANGAVLGAGGVSPVIIVVLFALALLKAH